MTVDRIFVGGIPIDRFTVNSLHETILNRIRSNNKTIYLYANAFLVELANGQEKWLVQYYNEPDKYVICDGAGIQLAARITRQSVPIKIAYNIWFWDLINFLAKHQVTIFLLGGNQDTIEKAVSNILKAQPQLKIVGSMNGYFNKEKNSQENISLLNEINTKKPDILFVAFGMPIQEKWIKENSDQINTKGIFTCGGAFDFFAKNKSVAPKLIRKIHLEWAYRLLLEPRRLLRRYTIGNFKFLLIILKSKLYPKR